MSGSGFLNQYLTLLGSVILLAVLLSPSFSVVNASTSSDQTIPNQFTLDKIIQNLITPNQSTPQLTRAQTRANVTEWIETTLEITFEHPMQLTVTAKFKIHEISLPLYGRMVADGIRLQYSLETKVNATNPPIILSMYDRTNVIFDIILNKSFRESIRVVESPVLDLSSLYYPADANPYDPPIIITQYASFVGLDQSAYFSPAEEAKYNIKSASDVIEGALKLGATVTQDVILYADPGHTNTYIYMVAAQPIPETDPEQLTVNHPDSELSSKDPRVQFTFNNSAGIQSVKYIEGLELRARSPNRQTRERIQLDFNLDMIDFETIKINNSEITINSLKIEHISKSLPSNISDISILSADGIRLFYNNGIVNLFEVEKDIDSELQRIEKELQNAMASELDVSLMVNWSLSSVSGLSPLYYLDDTGQFIRMGIERPVTGYIYSTEMIHPGYFENVSSYAIEGLLNAGAQAKLDLSIKTNYSYMLNLSLPRGFLLENITPTGNSETFNFEYLLAPSQIRKLIIVSERPAMYYSSRADLEAKIDFHDVDVLSLSEYLGSVKISSKGVLHHIKFDPDSRFAKALPKLVSIDYYNSDVLRLVYSEDLMNITDIEEDLYAIIKENVSNLLKEDLKMSVDFDEQMLKFDGDVARMDDIIPIVFNIHASGKMRITEDRVVKMGSFITKQIELPLSGVRFWNVTYILILPQFIDILGTPWVDETNAQYLGPFVEQNDDGRYQLRVTIYGNSEDIDDYEINANVEIDLTIWFFLSKIVIPLVLSVILLITIIGLITIRRYSLKKIDNLSAFYNMEYKDSGNKLDKNIPINSSRSREGAFGKSFRKLETIPRIGTNDEYSERLHDLVPNVARQRKRSWKRSKRRSDARNKGRKSSNKTKRY